MEIPRETLLRLLDMQKVDSAIDRLQARKRNLPEQEELDRLTDELSALSAELGERQAIHDDALKRQRKIDGDVDMMSQKIAAEEGKLYSGTITAPKELSALQAEIESLKRRKSTMEDSELEVMEEAEAAGKVVAELEGRRAELEAKVSVAERARDEASSQIDAELATLNAERDAWRGKFDQETLDFYDDLRSKRAGVAIAAFVDGTCQGCHMRLPHQEAERVRSAQGVVYCDECRRLLVPM